MNVAKIRALIEQGMTDADIEAMLDDARCENFDAMRAEQDDAGWTELDTQLMNAAYRDTPRFNDAGEWMC